MRAGIVGWCIGVGLWANPMAIVYASIVVAVFFLQSIEWRLLYQRVERLCDRYLKIPAGELFPVLTLGAGGLVVLAFFSTSCQPAIPFGIAQQIARLTLLSTGLGIAASVFFLSQRRKTLIIAGLALGGGFLLGTAPQWSTWLFHGIVPSTAINPTCPPEVLGRAKLVIAEMLPLALGIPGLTIAQTLTAPQAAAWGAMFVLMLTAMVFVFWRERGTLWSLWALKPLSRDQVPGVILGALFALPVILALLGGNAASIWSTRYLLITWQAGAIVLAVFLVRSGRPAPRLSALLLGAWLLQVGVGNLTGVSALWQQRGAWWPPAAVAELRAYVEEQGVTGGYADYLLAYPLSFLTDEKIIIAPYNGIDRYKGYTTWIEAMPTQAFIFCGHCLPPEASGIDDLARGLRIERGFGSAWPHLAASLHDKEVHDRRLVGHWGRLDRRPSAVSRGTCPQSSPT